MHRGGNFFFFETLFAGFLDFSRVILYNEEKTLRNEEKTLRERASADRSLFSEKETPMILVCCLDKKDGLLFNKRRQSRDRALVENLLATANGAPIHIAPYSAALFTTGATVSDAPHLCAGAGEYYFYEGISVLPDRERIEGVILYLWNREYPADVRFDRGILAAMRCRSREHFVGTSHEKITKEVYTR